MSSLMRITHTLKKEIQVLQSVLIVLIMTFYVQYKVCKFCLTIYAWPTIIQRAVM